MITRDPTAEEMIDYGAWMCRHFDAVLVDKSSATEMKLVADFLGALGILDAQAFLESYATTVGRKIYLPFVLGQPKGVWTLKNQFMVLAHECMHVRQNYVDPIGFSVGYLTDAEKRALYEAEAYQCQCELSWHAYGTYPDPDTVAGHLSHYNCGPSEIKLAATFLRDAKETVELGGVTKEGSQVAIQWARRAGLWQDSATK